MLSLIVAKGKNNEIGKDNKLLWDLPEDTTTFNLFGKRRPMLSYVFLPIITVLPFVNF